MATEEIQISELELADEVLADMVLPVDTATDTKAVTLKQLKAWLGTSLPIGSIFASVGKIDDERFSLLDGKTISRIGTYEAFCNKVVENVQAGKWKACTEEEFNLEVSETGQCGKFVVSNDYVRIPKLGNSLCSGIVNGTIPVVGNGGAIVYTNGNQTVEANLMSAYGFGNSSASIASFGNGQNLGTWNSVKLTTNPTKSGIEGKINSVEVFYYMVISTEGQTASVDVDINKVYEDLNLKINENSFVVDGQWIYEHHVLNTSKTEGAIDIDLSEILPNDGAKYEVLLNCQAHIQGTSQAVYVRIGSDLCTNHFTVAGAAYYGNNFATVVVAVGSGRYITRVNSSGLSTSGVWLQGYRRIGSNK